MQPVMTWGISMSWMMTFMNFSYDGFGSGDNELFQIDGNGTLRFVGEEMIRTRELNIRVRATDLATESIEKSFAIQYEHKVVIQWCCLQMAKILEQGGNGRLVWTIFRRLLRGYT